MHDAAYKDLFSHPRMVADLLRGFAAGQWSDELDYETLEKMPAEFVSKDLRRRQVDTVWRVRFRNRWLYVLVLLEFQSTVDPYMAVRMLVYTGLLYQDLIRRDELGPDGELPPVLPIVLYNGRARWTAALDIGQMMAPVGEDLSRYQPSLRYFLLDEGKYRDDDLPWRNLVSAVVRLENSRTPAELKRAVDALTEWLGGPGEDELKRSFGEWIRQVLMPSRFASEGLPPRPQLEEVRTMLAERVEEWFEEARKQGHAQGVKEGREEGREEGRKEGREEGREEGRKEGREEGIERGTERIRAEERALLCRQAARKFGDETAERLSGLLDGLTAPGQLVEIGEWIIECDTDMDLLERTGRVIRRS